LVRDWLKGLHFLFSNLLDFGDPPNAISIFIFNKKNADSSDQSINLTSRLAKYSVSFTICQNNENSNQKG
jgi:hypothetical protein